MHANWIKPRPVDAVSGSEFAERTAHLNGRARQQAALQELRNGNVPEFLRYLKPIYLNLETRKGKKIQITLWVTPDYLAIGSDDDYLRIPLTRPTAVTIASEWGFVLPTRKIVDEIHKQAQFHCTPKPLPPGKKMRSSEYYLRHHKLIQDQLAGRPSGELVSGHKKDVVLTNRLLGNEKIAIYGWHQENGKPIQGLSTVHGARYADYSHGIRLVLVDVCVDGQNRAIYDIVKDPEIGPALSYEGVIARFRNLMSWRP